MQGHMIYTAEERQAIIFRLTALWALNECGLGGVLHALRFPFTGLVVGGIAVALITFILYFSNIDKKTIFNSLLLVLIIKLVISPHTSVTAYFAVTFQALCSFFIYRVMGIHGLSILLVCMLCFFETVSQKILTLTIIGGVSFWRAVDVFAENIGKQFTGIHLHNTAFWLLGTYYGIYLVFSLIAAFFIFSLLGEISKIHLTNRPNAFKDWASTQAAMPHGLKKSKARQWWLYSAIVLFVLITFTLFGEENRSSHFITYYLLRTLSIVLFWYFLLMPALLRLTKKYLNAKMASYQADVDEILLFFPTLKSIVLYAWHSTRQHRGLKRLKYFFTLTLMEVLSFK